MNEKIRSRRRKPERERERNDVNEENGHSRI